ncbi:MAG: ribosomal RNA small subunit methyltransferase A, partial [Acidimicrobiia bacterium]|nr:ribosomal RNA small subunit methyltransferase A [Acidimicrobiia bacterium]
ELGGSPGNLRITGNLPYNISTPVLFHLLKMSHWINDMTFMLQREVVERMTAVPGNRNYGRLSVMLEYHCKVERLFHVPPEAFRPQPKVHSSVVRLRPHRPRPLQADDENALATVVRTAFGQRRKTLRNGLKSLAAAEVLERLPIDLGTRPEQLGLADYVRISDAISSDGGK